MGIVQKQAFKNTIITYLGFGIGAINALFLFTNFMTESHYGLIAYILSTANIMMPIIAFGTQNTLIKFYSSYKTQHNINKFLTLMLTLPLILAIPVGAIGYFSFDVIVGFLAQENKIIKDYVCLIYITALALAYFELFFSWQKVQMHSVFGNFMKEVFPRITVMGLLFCLYFDWFTINTFIYAVVGMYFLRTFIMSLYAFYLRPPVLRFGKLFNFSAVIKYSALIIIAGSVGSIILEIDKTMIGKLLSIENVAFYSVAIYIATVIGVPARSMSQITGPITAKLLNEKNTKELEVLYKKSSLNLFIVSGFIFLLIVLNINQLYFLIKPEYSVAVYVVFIVSIAKLSDNVIGNINAILFNSNYYRIVLLFGVILAAVTIALNFLLIPNYGINGAAFATIISILFYNSLKIIFVYRTFKLLPFTLATLKVLILILLVVLVFYFWDFPFHPIFNIGLKSLLITFVFVPVVYVFKFSEEINILLKKGFNKFL